MLLASFSTALGAVFNALFLIAALYIYLALARQIKARPFTEEPPPAKVFGLPEAALALLLIGWFGLNILAASSVHHAAAMKTRELFANALFSIGLVLFVAAFLKLRGFVVTRLAGFTKLAFWRAASTGTVLLLAAYPLIFLADLLTQRLLGGDSGKQEIVELFNTSTTLEQRVMIILLAVAIAPLAEEFIFRFFLYGLIKRYFGRAAGLAVTALLFAAVHTHLPSFAPLFVLGSCFTLAYEWSGSILVSMTMHALFNSLTLTALAFPELTQQ